MAAKRETSLLDDWVDSKPPTVSVAASNTPRAPLLELGIDGLTDLELVSVSSVASVYRAVQPALQRTVAVKVLHDEPGSPSARNFENERRVTSQLTGHAGIVPLLAAGTTGGGKPYLLLPFYRRGSMSRLMVDHGPLHWREAAFLVESIAVTMSEVHGRGLIHGNLTPSNILLTDFLLPRVSDFAASVPIGAASGPTDAPSSSTTPDPVGDPATDVEALGAMLWSLMLGAPNQQAPERNAEAAAGVAAPPALLRVIDRTMSDDPDRRPTSAAAFVTDLRRAAQSGSDTGPVATIGSPSLGHRVGDAPLQPGTAGTAPGSRSSAGNTAVDRPRTAGEADSTINGSTPAGSSGGNRAADGSAGAGESVAASITGEDGVRDAATSATDGGSGGVDGLAPSAEARYILALVACIAIAVLVMVLAAVLAVS